MELGRRPDEVDFEPAGSRSAARRRSTPMIDAVLAPGLPVRERVDERAESFKPSWESCPAKREDGWLAQKGAEQDSRLGEWVRREHAREHERPEEVGRQRWHRRRRRSLLCQGCKSWCRHDLSCTVLSVSSERWSSQG
jgi:hypothetical protein